MKGFGVDEGRNNQRAFEKKRRRILNKLNKEELSQKDRANLLNQLGELQKIQSDRIAKGGGVCQIRA